MSSLGLKNRFAFISAHLSPPNTSKLILARNIRACSPARYAGNCFAITCLRQSLLRKALAFGKGFQPNCFAIVGFQPILLCNMLLLRKRRLRLYFPSNLPPSAGICFANGFCFAKEGYAFICLAICFCYAKEALRACIASQ